MIIPVLALFLMPMQASAWSDEALAKIAKGDPAAIAAGAKAARSADAGDLEGLQDAFGKAMQVAPALVLPLVNSAPTLQASQICLPFLSAEVPGKEIRATIGKTQTALAGVTDPALASAVSACRAQIATNLSALASRGL